MVRVTSSREVAFRTLRRIESEGAYANLTMASALDRSRLSPADRRFVTDLVYGTTRMRRACDAPGIYTRDGKAKAWKQCDDDPRRKTGSTVLTTVV
jgi:hypothetical protein